MPLLFFGPMETHSSWTGIHLQCWPWPYAIHSCCRPVEVTSYWLLWKEWQCHWLLPSGLPQGFLLLSHDWCVRRSSCPPPHEYRGKIHPRSSWLGNCHTIGPAGLHTLNTMSIPSVTPNASPSAFTTVFACARAWSIIIGENCRLDLCTITF